MMLISGLWSKASDFESVVNSLGSERDFTEVLASSLSETASTEPGAFNFGERRHAPTIRRLATS